MPFSLLRVRHSGRAASNLACIEHVSKFAPVPAPWNFLRSGNVALALAAPTQIAALNPEAGASPCPIIGSGISDHLPGLVLLEGFLSNRDELIRQLGLSSGGAASDAELVATAFRSTGAGILDRLRGNYAICIVQSEGDVIHAARDQLGGRTLYHAESDELVAVASRSGCIASLPEFGSQEDPAFLVANFALRATPEPGRTAFAGVHELLPGEVRHWRAGRVSSRRNRFRFESRRNLNNAVEAVEAFSAGVEQSVAAVSGQRGDVAIMLSGGMDSGPAAVVASEQLTARGNTLVPISWVLPDNPRSDEERWIRMLCDRIGRPLTMIQGGSDSAFADMTETAISPDMPLFNAYRALKNACYRSAADRGCEVILNGNAGDQLYPPSGLLTEDLVRRGRYRAAVAVIMSRLSGHSVHRIRRDPVLRGAVGSLLRGVRLRRRGRKARAEWLTPMASRQLVETDDWPPEASDHVYPGYARRLTGAGMAFGLAHEAAWSERFGLERRDPFHDEGLVRLMLSLPVEFSYRAGMDKWLMREAMTGRMPESFRLKRRTGLLHSLFESGWNAHRAEIHNLLFTQQTTWQRYVRADFVARTLKHEFGGPEQLAHRPMLVVAQCIGYALWRRFWEQR